MTSKKTTRRALFSSVMSLLLCCSMLLGTTFAWFTDSVTSTGNIIKSGTLDVEMWYGDKADLSDLANIEKKNPNDRAIFYYDLWEPGFTQTKYIQIRNVGDLAFQYQLRMVPNDVAAKGTKLAEVIDVYCAIVDDSFAPPTRDTFGSMTKLGTLKDLFASETGVDDGVLLPRLENGVSVGSDKVEIPDGEKYVGDVTVCIALHMQEEAGNEYQNLSIGNGFDVQLIAAQMTYEMDSFDELYDQTAQWPIVAEGSAAVVANGATIITVYDDNHPGSDPIDDPGKIAVVTVPAAAVAQDVEDISVTIVETEDPAGFTVADDKDSKTYDVTVTGINGTTKVKVELFLGKGLTGLKLYHEGVEMADDEYVYSADTGYVEFESASFSPFTVVYDAVAEEIPAEPSNPGADPDDLPAGIPVAKVTELGAKNDITWNSFGPFVAADSAQQLESTYRFECPEDYDEEYLNWICDYYVSVDQDIDVNEIFLGGNYGDYNWVGFTNPFAIEANEEIALLATAFSGEPVKRGDKADSGWTYEGIEGFVKTFLCGVSRVNNGRDLAGVTFTVNLSLINPDDPTEYYNVNTVKYTFPEAPHKVSNSAELTAAVAAGETNLYLADGEYSVDNCGGKTLTISGSKNAVLKLKNEGEDGCDYGFGDAGTGVGNVTFNGITIDTTANTGNYKGYAYMKGTFNDCDFVGAYSLNNANDFVFNRCTFDFENGYFWTWGANSVTFNDCTFNGNGKNILAHGYASTVIDIIDCDFAATEVGKTGAGDPTAAVEIDPAGSNTYTINFSGNNTKTEYYNGWTRVKDESTGHIITGV